MSQSKQYSLSQVAAYKDRVYREHQAELIEAKKTAYLQGVLAGRQEIRDAIHAILAP